MEEEFIDELKSLNLYLKYVLGTKNVESHLLLDAMMRMERVGKVVIEKNLPEDFSKPYVDLNDIKAVCLKFIERIAKEIAEKSNGGGE